MNLKKLFPCPDPQARPPERYCSLCRSELFDGDPFYSIDGLAVCLDCFPDFAAGFFSDRLAGGPAD